MPDLRDVTITEKTDREWYQKFLSEVIMGAGTLEKRTEWMAPEEVVTLLVQRIEATAAAERKRIIEYLQDGQNRKEWSSSSSRAVGGYANPIAAHGIYYSAGEVLKDLFRKEPPTALDELLAKARDEALVEAASLISVVESVVEFWCDDHTAPVESLRGALDGVRDLRAGRVRSLVEIKKTLKKEAPMERLAAWAVVKDGARNQYEGTNEVILSAICKALTDLKEQCDLRQGVPESKDGETD